jgi:hypothetical protein
MRILLLTLTVVALSYLGLSADDPKVGQSQASIKSGDPAPPIKATK